MTEFAVGAATLSLLLLGSLMLAGYLEVDRRVVVAARNAAWQAPLPSTESDAPSRVRALHRETFADSGLLDPTGRRFLVGEEGVALEEGRQRLAGVAGGAAELLLAPLRVSSGFMGSSFDLSERGLFQGRVRATVNRMSAMPAPFDELELQLHASYGILGDAWHAGGVRHVRERASGLVPTHQLAAISALWRPLSVPLGVLEPSLRQLCLGLIEPDRIPEDRLGAGRTPLPDSCP